MECQGRRGPVGCGPRTPWVSSPRRDVVDRVDVCVQGRRVPVQPCGVPPRGFGLGALRSVVGERRLYVHAIVAAPEPIGTPDLGERLVHPWRGAVFPLALPVVHLPSPRPRWLRPWGGVGPAIEGPHLSRRHRGKSSQQRASGGGCDRVKQSEHVLYSCSQSVDRGGCRGGEQLSTHARRALVHGQHDLPRSPSSRPALWRSRSGPGRIRFLERTGGPPRSAPASCLNLVKGKRQPGEIDVATRPPSRGLS
jgi:hypothetical protein